MMAMGLSKVGAIVFLVLEKCLESILNLLTDLALLLAVGILAVAVLVNAANM